MKKEIIYPDNSDLEYLNYLLFELYKVIKFDELPDVSGGHGGGDAALD